MYKRQPEDSDVLWKALGDLNEFYAVRAEWEHVGVMATWMPEGTEFYNVDSDLVVSADVDVYKRQQPPGLTSPITQTPAMKIPIWLHISITPMILEIN